MGEYFFIFCILFNTFFQPWFKQIPFAFEVALPTNSRNLVKEATTTALVFPQVDVGKAAAQVLAKIGAIEIPPNEWQLVENRVFTPENGWIPKMMPFFLKGDDKFENHHFWYLC